MREGDAVSNNLARSVRTMSAVLASTSAVLCFGGNTLNVNFMVRDIGVAPGTSIKVRFPLMTQAVSVGLASPPPIGGTSPNTGAFTDQRGQDFAPTLSPYIDVRADGAVPDAVQLSCSITSGSYALACSGPYGKGFTPAAVGKLLAVRGAGAKVANTDNSLITTIATYVDSNHVTLNAPAQNTASRAMTVFGTDNGVAFCAATQCTKPMYTGIFGNGILSGRELYLPGGAYVTSQPLYVRENMTARGAGQGGTQIFLLSLQNPLQPPATVNFATANITPVICLGNATAGTGTCSADLFSNGATGSVAAYDITVTNMGANTVGILATSQGQRGGDTAGVYVYHNWFQPYYGFVGWHTLATSVDGNECDTSHVCITGSGDGSATPVNAYGWQISNNQLGNVFAGIWLDGMQDLVISNNNSQNYQYAIWIYSPLRRYTSYRILINGNDLGGTNPSFASQNLIEFGGPCVDCSILNNHLSYSGNHDINLETAASGTTNLLISKNHFIGSRWSSISTNTVTSGSWVGEGNVWNNPGQYAVFSGNMNVKFDNNTCVSPFHVNLPTSGGANPYENGCFFFTGSTASTVEASNNSVTSPGSAKYPALNLYGAGISITGLTSGNRSDYSGCAVCDYSGGSGLHTSLNELVTNYGSSGAALF